MKRGQHYSAGHLVAALYPILAHAAFLRRRAERVAEDADILKHQLNMGRHIGSLNIVPDALRLKTEGNGLLYRAEGIHLDAAADRPVPAFPLIIAQIVVRGLFEPGEGVVDLDAGSAFIEKEDEHVLGQVECIFGGTDSFAEEGYYMIILFPIEPGKLGVYGVHDPDTSCQRILTRTHGTHSFFICF